MSSSQQGRKMCDYDRGHWLFRMYVGTVGCGQDPSGYSLPAYAPRAMVDGWNKARAIALKSNQKVSEARSIKGLTERKSLAESCTDKSAYKQPLAKPLTKIEEGRNISDRKMEQIRKMESWLRNTRSRCGGARGATID